MLFVFAVELERGAQHVGAQDEGGHPRVVLELGPAAAAAAAAVVVVVDDVQQRPHGGAAQESHEDAQQRRPTLQQVLIAHATTPALWQSLHMALHRNDSR